MLYILTTLQSPCLKRYCFEIPALLSDLLRDKIHQQSMRERVIVRWALTAWKKKKEEHWDGEGDTRVSRPSWRGWTRFLHWLIKSAWGSGQLAAPLASGIPVLTDVASNPLSIVLGRNLCRRLNLFTNTESESSYKCDCLCPSNGDCTDTFHTFDTRE